MSSTEQVDHCIELLAPLGAVRARRMFGGHGLYVDDLFVALIAGERLYLKVDAATLPAFERAGSEPFCYRSATRDVVLGYRSAPDEAMDSPDAMRPWARLALQAALAARAAQALRRPRKPASASNRRAPKR